MTWKGQGPTNNFNCNYYLLDVTEKVNVHQNILTEKFQYTQGSSYFNSPNNFKTKSSPDIVEIIASNIVFYKLIFYANLSWNEASSTKMYLCIHIYAPHTYMHRKKTCSTCWHAALNCKVPWFKMAWQFKNNRSLGFLKELILPKFFSNIV